MSFPGIEAHGNGRISDGKAAFCSVVAFRDLFPLARGAAQLRELAEYTQTGRCHIHLHYRQQSQLRERGRRALQEEGEERAEAEGVGPLKRADPFFFSFFSFPIWG